MIPYFEPNINDDIIPYLNYFYNVYATQFSKSSFSVKNKNKEQVHLSMKFT